MSEKETKGAASTSSPLGAALGIFGVCGDTSSVEQVIGT